MKNNMELEKELSIWIKVNSCETAEELSEVILSLADEDGAIQGRDRKFPADRMAEAVSEVVKGNLMPNVLTREYGIRQQALYIRYYENL